ncbi:hypothetical protein ACH61_01842 [Rathayibacter tanaceti]|uniref:Uncharacterized protein n=1 Tax=Rathayibacter tanaceti TaxID=1671680 RepID=A0A162J229_9MICO|nr:hypothetical protein ACH61_01842 [Rathayibacter tanaceti]
MTVGYCTKTTFARSTSFTASPIETSVLTFSSEVESCMFETAALASP